MANEKRLRFNSVGGLIDDNPLTSGATTLNSQGLANLGVIDTTSYAVLVLDPDGIEGNPEIVYATAHTAGATSATIVRGQEGTAALQHSLDIPWAHAPTALDFDRKEILSVGLTTNVAMVQNTWTDILTLALTPGTWSVRAQAVMGGTISWQLLRVWDGTTVFAAASAYHSTTGGGVTLSIVPFDLTVAANTTLRLAATSDAGSGVNAHAQLQLLNTPTSLGTVTRLIAERVV